MLDFDYVCERKRPSVAAMVYPFRSVMYRVIRVRYHHKFEVVSAPSQHPLVSPVTGVAPGLAGWE